LIDCSLLSPCVHDATTSLLKVFEMTAVRALSQQKAVTGTNATNSSICRKLRKTGNTTTLWRLLLPNGYSYKSSCARPG